MFNSENPKLKLIVFSSLGLNKRAPSVSPANFEDDQMLFRRDSLPVSHLSMRDQHYESRNAVNDHLLDSNPDRDPPAKRPKLIHSQDR